MSVKSNDNNITIDNNNDNGVTKGGQLDMDDTNYLINAMEIQHNEAANQNNNNNNNNDNKSELFSNGITMGLINEDINTDNILAEMDIDNTKNKSSKFDVI